MRHFCASFLGCLVLAGSGSAPAHPGLAHDLERVSQALQTKPEAVNLRLARAELLNRQGRREQALVELEIVERLAPFERQVFAERAFAEFALGYDERAERSFIRFFALGGEGARARSCLGMLYERSGRLEEAREELGRAFELAPTPDRALAFARFEQRHFGPVRARAVLERALAVLGDSAVLRRELCVVHERLGDFRAALVHVEALLAQASLRAPYRAEKARLLLKLGRDAEARLEITRGLAELRGRVTPLHRLARARLLIVASRNNEARAELEQALLSAPRLAAVRSLLKELGRTP